MEYNYKKFISKEVNSLKSKGLGVGDIVPNFKLFSLSGNEVQLFGDTNKIIVLESGSITCPVYSWNIADMNKLAKDYPDVNFKVLYVREAHPGKKIPGHRNIGEKIALAGKIKNYFPENREIVIDDIDGTAHKKLGLLSDLLLVIGKDRKILYKLDWNSPQALKDVLKNLKEGKSMRDIVSKSRNVPITIMLSVLFRAGDSSLLDLLKSVPNMMWQRFGKSVTDDKK